MKQIETFCKEKGIIYKSKQLLANYTTLRIGGEAEILAFPNEENISALLETIKDEGLPYYVFGGGSNLLIGDKGFRGIIINTKNMDTISLNGCMLTVGAGAKLGRILAFVLKRGFSGMEGLIGIPGTVGGAIFVNAGSFGYEIKDVLEEIDIFDEDLNLKTLKRDDINFQYRSSGLTANSIIKRAKFKLKNNNESTFEIMKDFLNKKRATQPITERSAGCVFKNPEGFSAGYLIDKAGLKGMRIGDILVSNVHANFFINVNKGKAKDFLTLMDIVRDRVFKLFSIELKPEIRILGA